MQKRWRPEKFMIETERLYLRRMSATDVDAIFAMRADEKVMRFIRTPNVKRAETENWIDLVSSRWAEEKIGFCAVIEKQSREFAGWCGLWRLRETGEIEIGYAIAGNFWGRGFATEAAEAFLRYGFEELNLEKIVAVAFTENTASHRVMEKLGMRFDYVGEFYGRDMVHYSIRKEDFFNAKPQSREAAEII